MKLSEEDKAATQAKRIIDPDFEPEEDDNIEYVYKRLTLDMKDIAEFMEYDNDHIQLLKYNNVMYIAKYPYTQFAQIYQDLTGSLITVLSEAYVKE